MIHKTDAPRATYTAWLSNVAFPSRLTSTQERRVESHKHFAASVFWGRRCRSFFCIVLSQSLQRWWFPLQEKTVILDYFINRAASGIVVANLVLWGSIWSILGRTARLFSYLHLFGNARRDWRPNACSIPIPIPSKCMPHLWGSKGSTEEPALRIQLNNEWATERLSEWERWSSDPLAAHFFRSG